MSANFTTRARLRLCPACCQQQKTYDGGCQPPLYRQLCASSRQALLSLGCLGAELADLVQLEVPAQLGHVAGGPDVVLGHGHLAVRIHHDGGTDEALVGPAVVLLLAPRGVGLGNGVVLVRQEREGQAFGVGEGWPACRPGRARSPGLRSRQPEGMPGCPGSRTPAWCSRAWRRPDRSKRWCSGRGNSLRLTSAPAASFSVKSGAASPGLSRSAKVFSLFSCGTFQLSKARAGDESTLSYTWWYA